MGIMDFKREEELKRLVAWCVIKGRPSIRYNLSLLDYVYKAQFDLNLEMQYRIVEPAERSFAEIILENFQQTMVQDYFNDRIPLQRSKYSIPEKEFFMMYLFIYLSEQSERCTIKDIDIRSGDRLTDFGVVFYKIYYIAFLSCKSSEIYSKEIAGWLRSKYFTDVIDRRKI